MQTLYNVFKLVHVAAVIVWLGGLVAVGILNARLAREQQRQAMAALARASGFFGGAVVGPAAVLTLLAGLGMVAASGMSVATLWIAWGLAGILASLVLGATAIRRTGEQLNAAMQEAQDEGVDVPALQTRLRTLSILNLLLFSVV